jgi:uncharacterized protein DUF3168
VATTLLGAIVERFTADFDLNAAVPSGIWVSQIPEGKTLPFVCLIHGGEVPDWTFEREYVEEGRVQFLCYAKGCAAAEAIATLIKTAFDWQTVTITGAASIKVERVNYQVSSTELFRAPDGEIVYEALVEYIFWVRKTY